MKRTNALAALLSRRPRPQPLPLPLPFPSPSHRYSERSTLENKKHWSKAEVLRSPLVRRERRPRKRLMDIDYSLSDPAWDYAAEYHAAIALQHEAQALIATLSEQEERSPEADQAVREYLKQIALHSTMILSLLD